jgi:hypothetical protein
MAETPNAYPLAWPPGYPRTPKANRESSRFHITLPARPPANEYQRPPPKQRVVTVAEALTRLQDQIDKLGGRLPLVSSNLELRLDGLPRSGLPEPSDPGVCVYFQLKAQPVAMPSDHFLTVAANIAAVAAHIDAVRRIERYGVSSVELMFTSFMAIRGPGPKPWREVFGIPTHATGSRMWLRARYTDLAKQRHPDADGSEVLMAELNVAYEDAMREILT